MVYEEVVYLAFDDFAVGVFDAAFELGGDDLDDLLKLWKSPYKRRCSGRIRKRDEAVGQDEYL